MAHYSILYYYVVRQSINVIIGANMLRQYSIVEVAKEIGIHTNTLKNWERKGLITPGRDRNGWRVFGEEDIKKIKAIADSSLPIQKK